MPDKNDKTESVKEEQQPKTEDKKSAVQSTTVDGSEFEVLSVERRGEKLALQVRGEVVVSPSDAEREKYLNTAVGSRMKFDMKPGK
jgi:hypothetical protein